MCLYPSHEEPTVLCLGWLRTSRNCRIYVIVPIVTWMHLVNEYVLTVNIVSVLFWTTTFLHCSLHINFVVKNPAQATRPIHDTPSHNMLYWYRHNRPVISIVVDIWTVPLWWFWAYILHGTIANHHREINISYNTLIGSRCPSRLEGHWPH